MKKQTSIEKFQSYVASLKNASHLDHVHSKHLSQTVCSESVRSEPKSVRNFPKALRSDSKISNDGSPSFTGHESFIDLLDTPQTSGKTKLQTSSNRTNPLREPIDEFTEGGEETVLPIYPVLLKLVEGEETVLPINNLTNLTVMNALHQELESRQLPPTELMNFDGSPSQWPEFIAHFKERVHLKQTFSDQMRMERLLNVLRGDARRSVESIGKSKNFYAAALKSLKRDFGNAFYVSHTKLSELFDKPHENDRTALRDFHQKVKCINTWLKSMGYLQTFSSTKYMVLGELPRGKFLLVKFPSGEFPRGIFP